MIRGLQQWRDKNNIPPSEPTASESRKSRVLKTPLQRFPQKGPVETVEAVPMMYRAQIQGRCNLQYAGERNNLLGSDLEKWKTEWVQPQPQNQEPRYQYEYSDLDSSHFNHSIYSFEIEFPYRVFTNSGQDSISRPVLDRYGIPFIPGSSIKGVLRRCLYSAQFEAQQKERIKQYCGDEEHPGTLRFHGAYPIKNWANRMVDVVHPQQGRQVRNNTGTSASALISFYQPKFVFEFSSAKQDMDWQELEQLIRQALQYGLGGKTSTGYGFSSRPVYADANQAIARHIAFIGQGVGSVLLDGKAEFRPNLFKATLRGHLYRLLAGACNSESVVEREVNRLLGGTEKEGVIQLFWEDRGTQLNLQDQPCTYKAEGILHLATSVYAHPRDLEFIEKVLKFAYVMGGFGKSWRRVWHKQFYVTNPHYRRSIGCHWICSSLDWWTFHLPKTNAHSTINLQSFLEELREDCRNRLGSPPPILAWRESWCFDQVVVYSKVVNESQAITLFHRDDFKTTPAIGGKKPEDQRPKFVSSVWHRMLPLDNGQYLEIVTIFHGDRSPWKRKEKDDREIDQLRLFVQAVKQAGLNYTWGTDPYP